MSPHRARGRPYGAPDQNRANSADAPASSRTAWLLRVNRLHGPEPKWVALTAFAQAFPGGLWTGDVSTSTVSRWERGRTDVPIMAVRRYEEMLRLTHSSLSSTVDMLNRYANGVVRSHQLTPRRARRPASGAQRTRALLERALGDALMGGAEWDEFTASLAAYPAPLRADSDWSALAERLVMETLLSEGVPWRLRHESLSRLLTHPAARPAMVSACLDWARDGSSPPLIEAMSLLDASSHPDAAAGVLGQLEHPSTDKAHLGALLACVRKVPLGHFSDRQLRRVALVTAELLHQHDELHVQTGELAASVLRGLPPGAVPASVRSAVRRLPSARTGRPPSPHRDVADRVALTAVSGMPRQTPQYEEVLLPALLAEVLFGSQPDERIFTAMLIASTPYRPRVAASLAHELARMPVARDPELATRILSALASLGGPDERPLVQSLVLSPSLPGEVVSGAADALGHMRGRSPDPFWRAALHPRRTGTAPDLPKQSPRHVPNELLYALGVDSRTSLLREVSDDPGLSAQVRARARWWIDVPVHVRESVTRHRDDHTA
ncbi:hypothetical protein [Streptomyces geranii]|uniref:hypothetical protein n=1 Tax=Streptomyces geranii TaxID=2058923 RepID=UPI000D040EBB|nr:hypothetical protein [Streptomyces geranii]